MAAAPAAAGGGGGADATVASAGRKRPRVGAEDTATLAAASAAPAPAPTPAPAPPPLPTAGGTGSGAAVVPCAWSTNAISHVWDEVAVAAPHHTAPSGSAVAASSSYSSGVDPATRLPVFMWRPLHAAAATERGAPTPARPPVPVSVEVTLAATGTLAGATRQTALEAAASRLCKLHLARACTAALAAQRQLLYGGGGGGGEVDADGAATSSSSGGAAQSAVTPAATYRALKHLPLAAASGVARYRAALDAFHAPGGGFDGWLHGAPHLEGLPVG